MKKYVKRLWGVSVLVFFPVMVLVVFVIYYPDETLRGCIPETWTAWKQEFWNSEGAL